MYKAVLLDLTQSGLDCGAGKENMFVFGVDAEDVPRLREERKDFKDYDPRWVKVMDSLLAGQFGDAEYFQVGGQCLVLQLLTASQ